MKTPRVDAAVDPGAYRFHGRDPRRKGVPRTGHHPRDPALHPTDDATQARRMDPTHDAEEEDIISMAREEK